MTLYPKCNKTKPLHLQSLADQLSAFCIGLIESNLNDEIFNANININGYISFRCDSVNRKLEV